MIGNRKKEKYIYLFGNGKAEGRANMRNLLGGKGANLAEMSRIKLPVPPGFTITTEACTIFFQNNQTFPQTLEKEVMRALKHIEKIAGGKFGHPKKPLLLSVRSGARSSMPGMMDTILNLGLNDQTTQALAQNTQSKRFAYDSYRRFVQIYADVVCGIEHHLFEDILDQHKLAKNYLMDTDMQGEDWQHIVSQYKTLFQQHTNKPFPQDPIAQLWDAIRAVFLSWQNERAKTYRRLHAIPEEWGTAVNIQAMVFGNMGNQSATGVAFTRNPSTGENQFYGEFLLNAQGEDVVAGLRTPQPLAQLEDAMPQAFGQLCDIRKKLEQHYRDMQDVEFTIEEGRLWMLQTRAAKRTAAAAIQCAADMVNEKLINQKEAVLRVDPAGIDQLLHPVLDPNAERNVLTRGLPASPGAASGEITFSAGEAENLSHQGHAVILVRSETSPEDIHGMHAAKAILTARGGMTSHAAVVARGMGRPCVVGASALLINRADKSLTIGDTKLKAGDLITIDGSTGEVILGEIPTLHPAMSNNFTKIMQWADQFRRMRIHANAETPHDAKTARSFNAEGIGLCRTEHMFFDAQRIKHMRKMIIAQNETQRRDALDQLLPLQREDFTKLFKIMINLPITIRLLDPPLHEFLPLKENMAEAAQELDVEEIFLERRIAQLAETNPMLGHRGCRLGITYPEIYEMQTRAILEAAIAVKLENKGEILPEIMIPLVAMRSELDFIKKIIRKTAAQVFRETGERIDFKIGTMIELPRAALCADDLAEEAEFFSFGTNDLTQTMFGISRDDSARFLSHYAQHGFFERNPFVSIDPKGVGTLMEIALNKAGGKKRTISCGVCGEHGGDPFSIDLCEAMELDYVSCSPYRVPIARLAAAQASIQHGYKPKKKKRKKI